MPSKKILTGIFLIGLLSACSIQFWRGTDDLSCHEKVATSRDRNVCKTLKDSVVIYAIFVDVDQFHPWTEFDIASTLDSVDIAKNWILSQADTFGTKLSIKVIHHEQSSKHSFHERKAKAYPLNLNYLNSSRRKHENHVFGWADIISKYAGRSVKKRPSSKVGTQIKISNTERLIAALRDKYETDNVALMFFVNGYYEDFPSVTFNIHYDNKVEFGIITGKKPAVIAHEFLHLFGAIDLYPHQNFRCFNYPELESLYPNEIMRIQHKNIDKLMLSPITRYYIGWQDDLDLANTRLLYHLERVLEY